MIWIIADLNSKNRELENKKPSITVTPEFVEDLWYLDVVNNGERVLLLHSYIFSQKQSCTLDSLLYLQDMMPYGQVPILIKRKL